MRSLLLPLIFAATTIAAPLTQPTPAHQKADPTSPALRVLASGAEPILADATKFPAPTGWVAIELPGPHEIYVANADINKMMEVAPGSAMRTAPEKTAPVLDVAHEAENAAITGLRGRWTQMRLNRPVIAYIQATATSPTPAIAATATAQAPATTNKANSASSRPQADPIAEAPVAPTAFADGGVGRPATTAPVTGPVTRAFQGQLVGTQKPFRPRRPYDYALNDNAGEMVAFLDFSRVGDGRDLALYVDKQVVVFGTAKVLPASKILVLSVDSIRLR